MTDRLSKVIQKHLETVELEPGRVHHVEIRHAHDCGHWDGKACDCEPTIASGAPIDRKYDEVDR